jgi:cell division septal protein FtsQ
MQLRKVESMGDKHAGVDFQDGTKVKVKPDTAKRALERYARMKPDEKEKWQKTAAHSHSGLSHASSDKKIDHTSPGQSKPQPARKPSYALDHDQHPADS